MLTIPLEIQKDKLFYLASPYSHKSEAKRTERFEEAAKIITEFHNLGYKYFSPIVHSHPMVKYGVGTSFEFWDEYDYYLLSLCHCVVVAKMAGWRRSNGIKKEVTRAKELNIPVYYLDISNLWD